MPKGTIKVLIIIKTKKDKTLNPKIMNQVVFKINAIKIRYFFLLDIFYKSTRVLLRPSQSWDDILDIRNKVFCID